MRGRGVLVACLALMLAGAPAGALTIRIGGTQPPPALGNPFTGVGPPSSLSWSPMFDGLTVLDADGKLQPALALAWTPVTPTLWRFTLRPGVTFHNGRPFDATAAAAVIAYLKSEDGRRFLVANELKSVVAARAVDPLTLEIETAMPDAILPTRLNLVMMVEPEAWKTRGPDAFALAPVGTGPFKLIDWGRGQGRARYEAYGASWRGKGQADRLEILTIADTSARMQALMADQIDIAIGIGPDESATLAQGGFKVIRQPYAAVLSLAFRTTRADKAPLKDPRVRTALNLAVDRGAIVNGILGGAGGIATQGATPETVGYNPAIAPYPYDPARARALLAEAGYPNGFRLVVLALTNLTMSDASVYQKVAEDLRRVGVDVVLRTSTFAAWLRSYGSGDWGDVDAFSLTWNAAPFQDAIRPIEYYSCAKANAFFCEPSLMPLIEAANRDMDPASRTHRLQDLLARLHELAPALLIVNAANIIVASPRVGDFRARVMGIDVEKLAVTR